MLKLENEYILLLFDNQTGSIKRIFDKQKQIDYISQLEQGYPFRVEYENANVSSEFESFDYELIEEEELIGYKFNWTLSPKNKVNATVHLMKGSNDIYFFSKFINELEQPVISLEYPIIPNLLPITENGTEDYLVHSFATGVKIQNPLEHFGEDSNGFRYMPYPEGFSGSTMQFFSYYGRGKGGLYFATYDSESYSKWHSIYKNENDLLEASFIHSCEDIGEKKGIEVPYPAVVKLLNGLDWYESADIYKEWATNQYWCQKGPIAELSDKDKSKWLMEDVGVSTFGINAGHDRSAWIKAFHEQINTQMFHILGPDWPQTTQDFGNHIPGGFQDWFPTKFNKETLSAIQKYDDKYAPFEFDYLFNINGAEGDIGKKALQAIPKDSIKSIDKYNFPLLCPVCDFTQKLHVQRDRQLQKEMNVDAIYYDISANNIMKICMDDSHGHPKGAGRAITMAYRENYQKTKQAMQEQTSMDYIPMGTEMMNEVFLDTLDYYQARAGGQPAAPLEGWNIKDLLKTGKAELIPLFTYVYHEFGEVRLDGWGKLVEEIGDLFFFTVARSYLWGGLYELNYEYSPMEMLNDEENTPEEHYYQFEPRGYQFSTDRAQYISKFANLRTGIGNKYLSYGKMLKPIVFACESVSLNWFHYNCDVNFAEYNDSGILDVSSIVHSAWQYRHQSIGLFFANVSDREQTIHFNLDLTHFGIFKEKNSQCKVYLDGEASDYFEMNSDENKQVKLSIPSHSVVMMEVM
ncbi:DUF6259 domain-containing protein [Gracilibacillus sp. D59]|uniref:DUF6259 domain-containing protein n=1 Tax=Gracilibacillus sp. D59 TaxID=3457434 RepID=UPI003FCDE383